MSLSQTHFLPLSATPSLSLYSPSSNLSLSHGELPVLCFLCDKTGQPNKLSRVVYLPHLLSTNQLAISEQRGNLVSVGLHKCFVYQSSIPSVLMHIKMVRLPKGHKFSLCKSQYEYVSSCMTCQCVLEQDTEHSLI